MKEYNYTLALAGSHYQLVAIIAGIGIATIHVDTDLITEGGV